MGKLLERVTHVIGDKAQKQAQKSAQWITEWIWKGSAERPARGSEQTPPATRGPQVNWGVHGRQARTRCDKATQQWQRPSGWRAGCEYHVCQPSTAAELRPLRPRVCATANHREQVWAQKDTAPARLPTHASENTTVAATAPTAPTIVATAAAADPMHAERPASSGQFCCYAWQRVCSSGAPAIPPQADGTPAQHERQHR